MGVSENVVYPEKPNGFANHYPYEKLLFFGGYTLWWTNIAMENGPFIVDFPIKTH